MSSNLAVLCIVMLCWMLSIVGLILHMMAQTLARRIVAFMVFVLPVVVGMALLALMASKFTL